MGLQTAVVYKAQAAAIATALNTMYAESGAGLTGMSAEILNPNHPLREFFRCVKMDAAGTFTADDAYIDAAFAGNVPRPQKETGDPFGIVVNPAVSS